MQSLLPVAVALLAVLALAGPVARRVHAPQPVVIAVLAFALAFVPGLPRAPFDPELILVAFLPPLLYSDAFDTSWVDFRRWLRPILMLAVGLVAATTLVVGLVAHALLPELPWAACFVLGAIVSPTDTVAVQAVIEKLRVPRRVTAILGGESLVNDATALVGVQLGVAVVWSGAFEAGEVAARFAWVAGGGVAIGLACGALFAWLNRVVRETSVLFVLSLLAPYLAFYVAYALNSSGVLAVVVAGFLVAWRIHTVPPEARVDLYTTWRLLVPLVNGLCFAYIGLETPRLFAELARDGGRTLVGAALCVAAAVILTRVAWTFPGAYLPLYAAPRLRRREGGYPPWRAVVLTSWCGMRGAVSLAAALALPATLADGSAFPGRSAILACTLGVILVTLVVQGSTLHALIRALGIRGEDDTEAEVRAAREHMLAAGIRRLDAFCSETSCPLSVHHWRALLADGLQALRDEDASERDLARTRVTVSQEVRRAVVDEQERELLGLRDQGRINDNTYLELQLELDRDRRAAAAPAPV